MPDEQASTVPRRCLGRMLRQHRAQAGISLGGAAEVLEYSQQKMWRIEAGRRATRAVDVKEMCKLYDVPPNLLSVMTALAGETNAKGWWHAYGNPIPAWFDLYPELEAEARRIRGYHQSVIPGILRTEGYAMAVESPRPGIPEKELPRIAASRVRRQRLLVRKFPEAPTLECILSEAVLLKAAGGPETMAQQLRHLLALTELPNVTIRVLPLAAGPHFGEAARSFFLLDFPSTNRTVSDLPIAYTEFLTGALYLDRPDELATYETVWSGLDALALDEDTSRDLIASLIPSLSYSTPS